MTSNPSPCFYFGEGFFFVDKLAVKADQSQGLRWPSEIES